MVCTATGVRADDSAKSIIEKGINAVGGADNIAKQKTMTWKAKGTFHGLGMPVEYTGEWFIEPPTKFKGQIDADFGGMKLTFIQILNGDKGWMSAMGNIQELEGDQLSELQNQFYEGRVAALVTLQGDAGFKIATLSESKVGDKAAVGVKVSHEGRPDISLFFDKDSGLLLKAARKAKDPMAGTEANQETLYSDYQDVGGVKRYKKMTITRDGKPYNEMLITEWKPVDKLPDSTFAKPAQ
jgi:hypothetical protein